MRVLLDTCVTPLARDQLRDVGHEVDWVGDWEQDPGDDEILSRAREQGRVLVTLDKDFGELAIVHGVAHHGIVRLVALSVREQAPVCQRVLELHGEELLAGAIVTAERSRLRIRPAEE